MTNDLMLDYAFKTKPMDHQLKVFATSRDRVGYGYLMEMGTGKTKVLIDNAGYLFCQGQINGLFVLAPKSICGNWAHKELLIHLPDHIDRKIVLWDKDTVALAKALKTLQQVEPLCLHILIMNIEALGSGSDRAWDAATSFLRGHRAMMAIDESTTIKNHKAMRTKYAIKLGKLAAYRRIMTGTPITQSPLDAFSQFEFLEEACLGSQSFYGFRNQYAVLRKRYVNGRSFDEIVGYQRLNELRSSLEAYSYRVLKSDCLDLPDKVYTVREVELSPQQRKYYEQIKEEALAVLSNGTVVTATLVLTQLLRLRQALCNIAPILEGEGTQAIGPSDPRTAEVMSLLEEAGEQKVIIWANFRPSIAKLVEEISKVYGPKSVGAIHGDVKMVDRQDLVSRFQGERHVVGTDGVTVTEPIPADEQIRFMVMQPRTGGFGLTMTAATLVIYHDHDWSLEVRQQSEDRAHRIGQKNAVTYVDIVAVGTVDEKIRAALMEKRDLAAKVTGDNLKDLLT